MMRRRHIYLRLVFVVIITTASLPVSGAATDRLRTIRDARILLAPQSKNEKKLEACVRLRDAGDAAILAIPALARQSKSDQPSIREHAFATLTRLVGDREAAVLGADAEKSELAS